MGVELPLHVVVTILECCVTFSGVKLSIRSFVLFMHQAITLPGIAKRICLNSIIDPNVEIYLFNQKQQDIYQLFKENIVGGASIIYHRNQQPQKSFTHNNPNKPFKSIVGYDANALYLHALSMNLPTQIPLIRREENEFKKNFPEFRKAVVIGSTG